MKLSVFILVFSVSGFALSQNIVPAAQTVSSNTVKPQTITLQLESVPLAVALDEIAKLGRVRIGYRRSIVDNKPRVTLNKSGLTVDIALRQVLSGTNLEAVPVPGGGIMVRERNTSLANGLVSGKVTDAKSGVGIAGATIMLGNERSVVSAEDGSFKLAGVPAGQYMVTIRSLGYTKQQRSVNVGEGSAVTVEIKMEHSTSVLDQVVVTGTVIASELRSVPNAITVITAKQIEERGITRIDQLFRGEIPGIFSMNRGSASPLDEVTMFSRGATALSNSSAGVAETIDGLSIATLTNPIKTFVDGVEMANSQYLNQIDPGSIERIEILTGPQASTIYGSNAINGVMQIFTKRSTSRKPQLYMSLSSGIAQNNFNSRLTPNHLTDAGVSGMEGRFSYNISSSWNYVGSWTPSKQTQRISANGGTRTEWARLTADASARQGITRNRQSGPQTEGFTDLRASGVYSPSATIFNGLSVPQISTLKIRTVGLSLGYRPVSWWSHELVVGSDAPTIETFTTSPAYSGSVAASDTALRIDASAASRTSERYSTTIQSPITSHARLNLTFGGDHWRTTGSSWSASPTSLTGNLQTPTVRRDRPAKNSGVFAQGQISLAEVLFFTYGVRADWNPNFGANVVVKPGRYGVSYTRDMGAMSAKLRASYGRSIRPPFEGQSLAIPNTNTFLAAEFGQFDSRLANLDLGPEHQEGGEGGMELYFGSRASFVATRYNQTVDNLISLVGNTFATVGFGLDSVRSLAGNRPATGTNCSSTFRDPDGYCYRYIQQYLNVGSIRNQGWELSSSLNLGPFSTRGTYSWTKSRILGITPRYRAILTGSSFEVGRPFNFIPEHTWALGTTYAHSGTTLTLAVNGTGMRYISDNDISLASSSNRRLPSERARMQALSLVYRALGSGYATADLNATHRFSSRAEAIFQVSNLTNYYQNDYSSFYASIGRQTRGGVRLRF